MFIKNWFGYKIEVSAVATKKGSKEDRVLHGWTTVGSIPGAAILYPAASPAEAKTEADLISGNFSFGENVTGLEASRSFSLIALSAAGASTTDAIFGYLCSLGNVISIAGSASFSLIALAGAEVKDSTMDISA